MHAYPENLARLVRTQWHKPLEAESLIDLPVYKKPDRLPSLQVLNQLLSTSYQASLLRDEDRPVRFRLMVRHPDGFNDGPDPADGLHILPFDSPFPLLPNELRRLAPAAPLERSLIGVNVSAENQLQIWGLIHSGESWLRTLEGSRRTFNPLPPSLVVSVAAPGHMAVAKGSLTVVRLLAGLLATPAPGVLEIAEPPSTIPSLEQGLVDEFDEEREKAGCTWARIPLVFVKRIRRLVALRIVSAIRRLQHGGTVLMLPPELARDPKHYKKVLSIKYSFGDSESRKLLSQLTMRLLKALAADCGNRFGTDHQVRWNDYLTSGDPAVIVADEAISEMARQIASLSAVDGAVVIGQPLEVLGFGAEISGHLDQVDKVARALDPRFSRTELESTLNVGTRHRSAYRFCNALPGASALVVSQDGTVRFVSCLDNRVVYSEHLSSGALNV